MNHEIFTTPNPVQLTIEPRTTPDEYLRTNSDLGPTMPMWRVQTEGYQDPQGQLIGMVSRDAGFLDSPDTEWISSGVNSKGPNAVAIGRHGNMLLWGFAASPTFLTDEAKLVFINAVHYIANFDKQPPIARKQQGTAMRSSVHRAIESISEAGYAARLAHHQASNAKYKERKAKVRARIESGEEVTQGDRRFLDMTLPPPPERLGLAKRYISEADWAALGDDPIKVEARLRADLPYLRASGWYNLVVDEELKAFGVANHDITLLDRAIETLNSKASIPEAQRARTLLERYTDQSFEHPKEWSTWFTTNRDRLFFTESGGYKWLVDTVSGRQPNKNTKATANPAPEADTDEAPNLEPDANQPVASHLTIKPLGDDRFALTVHVKILEGWHGYASVPQGSPYVPMTASLELPRGIHRYGDWQSPKGQLSSESPGLTTLEGSQTFRCELRGDADAASTVKCTLSFQVCDEEMCLAPTTTTLQATLGSAKVGG